MIVVVMLLCATRLHRPSAGGLMFARGATGTTGPPRSRRALRRPPSSSRPCHRGGRAREDDLARRCRARSTLRGSSWGSPSDTRLQLLWWHVALDRLLLGRRPRSVVNSTN